MSLVIPGTVLFQLFAGFLEAGPGINELALVSTEPGGDPALFRVGGTTGAGGGLAGDVFVGAPDPQTGVRRRQMVVLIQYKKDERTRGRDDVIYGELTVHVQGPPSPQFPDGMVPVALVLHDYVWIKGINGDAPAKPWLELPPPPAEPPPPVDDWLSPESQEQHAREIARIQAEVAPMPLDEGRVAAYMAGRNRDLAEVHDDELARAALDRDPCGGVNRVPL